MEVLRTIGCVLFATMVKLQSHQIAMMPVVIRVGSVTNIPTVEIRNSKIMHCGIVFDTNPNFRHGPQSHLVT